MTATKSGESDLENTEETETGDGNRDAIRDGNRKTETGTRLVLTAIGCLEDGNGDAACIDRAEKLTASLFRSPDDSALEVARITPVQTLGQFPLKGPLNLGGTRPTGLSFSAEQGLLAVATKPDTVYLISLRSRLETENGSPKDRIATSAGPTRR